ncbi:hypothetical protein L210DRAFT_3636667 [Boletus edulis BED1]|uniref:Uncharacterized protein n=1 Tax=Boletus edulis BED1 TaxID=1328754 RepID=A0AAD4BAV5_BOLED|nr:hypothetical protein L210DRAFT_3636667 [Boletus edulis BED1]
MSVLLDGASVEGRIDADSPRCIVSHAVAATYESVPSRAVIHAQYLGTNFTADVPVDIGDINCDVVVGQKIQNSYSWRPRLGTVQQLPVGLFSIATRMHCIGAVFHTA